VTGELYHVYNRGVDKRLIFQGEKDIQRFFLSMLEFNTIKSIGSIYEHSFSKSTNPKRSKKLVNFIAYCLNPNHFHFLLEQVAEKGIEKFMQRLGTGYTNYFNNKYRRTGSLFQGTFKAVHIEKNEYLLHLSAYINLNNHVHKLGSEASKFVKTSWPEYEVSTERKANNFCSKKIILGQFRSKGEYIKFARSSLESILERRTELENLGEILLEEPLGSEASKWYQIKFLK